MRRRSCLLPTAATSAADGGRTVFRVQEFWRTGSLSQIIHAIMLAVPAVIWPIIVAAAASARRITFTTRTLRLILAGIAIAVALSILNVFRGAWWPYDTQLGRVEGVAGYHDVHSYPQAEHLPGLVIYRFDGPLFFANAKTFRDEVRRMARADPPPTWILIAAEPMTDVDTTASDVLEELDEALNAQGISLVFAELKDPVRRKIEHYGLTRTINPQHFFPTIESAVAAFRRQTGAQWTDAGQAGSGEAPPAKRPPKQVRATFPHHPPASVTLGPFSEGPISRVTRRRLWPR
jgi:anti-anti-sigma regulatory factor